MDKTYLRRLKIPVSVIILHLPTFPFTGVFLLVRRVTKSSEYLWNNRAMKFCGWILIFMAVFPTIIGLIGNDTYRENIGTYFVMWFLPGLYTLFRAGLITNYIKNSKMSDLNLEENKSNYSHVAKEDYMDRNIDSNTIFHNIAKASCQYKVVTCTSCGAKKKMMVGTIDKCDFCDTPLECKD